MCGIWKILSLYYLWEFVILRTCSLYSSWFLDISHPVNQRRPPLGKLGEITLVYFVSILQWLILYASFYRLNWMCVFTYFSIIRVHWYLLLLIKDFIAQWNSWLKHLYLFRLSLLYHRLNLHPLTESLPVLFIIFLVTLIILPVILIILYTVLSIKTFLLQIASCCH